MGEFNVYGIYVPSLLVQALLAYICFRGLSPLTNKLIAQGWIALPSIFNLCFLPLITFGNTSNFCWGRCVEMFAKLKIELGE